MASPHYLILGSNGNSGGGSRVMLTDERIAACLPMLAVENLGGWLVHVSDTQAARKINVTLVRRIAEGGDFNASVAAFHARHAAR